MKYAAAVWKVSRLVGKMCRRLTINSKLNRKGHRARKTDSCAASNHVLLIYGHQSCIPRVVKKVEVCNQSLSAQ
jgi:hypothetical protein